MSMDVEAFDKIAREVFAPAYPLIARQIRERTGINEGVCVDVGCGGGYLGLALAQITRLQVWLLDILPGMLKICQENIRVCNLASQVRAIQGDVHSLPFPDSSINLVGKPGVHVFLGGPGPGIQGNPPGSDPRRDGLLYRGRVRQ